MKIGILTTYLALGADADSGIGQHYRILADSLADAGNEVHVFYLCDEKTASVARPAFAALSPAWRCTFVVAPLPAWLASVLKRSWPARQLLGHLWQALAARRAVVSNQRIHPIEIIETHSYNLPAFFLLTARSRPRILTRVSTTLGQMVAISPMRSRILGWEAALERNVIRRSDALVTHSVQHRDAICTDEGHNPAHFAIVPHGLVDPGEPAPAAPAAQVEFLFVGRFESRKGIDVLLAAIPQVAAACPSAIFTVAGSHGDKIAWSSFIAEHPGLVGTRVFAPGRVSPEELVALYSRCSVLVAPSRYESFGLIYVEAMSHGKPVIGCRAGGIPDVVTDGVTGLLAEPGDVTTLAACMIRLAGDAALRASLGANARHDFVTRFSADVMTRQSIALYRATLGSPGVTKNP